MRLKTRIIYRFNSILKYLLKLNILSTEESINYLIDNKCSLARYGDGELNIIMGGDIHFQDYNEDLANRLKLILTEKQNHIMIGIPIAINSTRDYKREVKKFWDMNMSTGRMHWHRYCNHRKQYISANMTRCYMDYEDKNKSKEWFKQFYRLWENLNILIVEGESSKLGVNNDIFKYCKSIKRLICPSKNAYDVYDNILKKIEEVNSSYDLVLVSLGPTATVICYDLSKLGIRAIDIGHLNLEYNKYIEEMNIDCNPNDILSLQQYEEQIIGYIR